MIKPSSKSRIHKLDIQELLRDKSISRFFTHDGHLEIPYPSKLKHSTYSKFLNQLVKEYQKYHEILRALMHNSTIYFEGGQRGYFDVDIRYIPDNLEIGSKVGFRYKIISSKPSFNIGQHRALFELVFVNPVKVYPISNDLYLMDESHMFVLNNAERRTLDVHPSHKTKYHIDLYRWITDGTYIDTWPEDITDENKDIGQVSETNAYKDRIRFLLDKNEVNRIGINRKLWETSRVPNTDEPKDESEIKHVLESDFRRETIGSFKEYINTHYPGNNFSDQTVKALYNLASKTNLNMITQAIFEVSTNVFTLDEFLHQFSIPGNHINEVKGSILDKKFRDTYELITKELHDFFENGPKSSNEFIVYMSVDHKLLPNPELNTLIEFKNFLSGYTSIEALKESDQIILVVHFPAHTPVLVLPDHIGITEKHKLIVLPDRLVFRIDKIESKIMQIEGPNTFKKLIHLVHNYRSKPIIKERYTYSLSLNPKQLEFITRDGENTDSNLTK